MQSSLMTLVTLVFPDGRYRLMHVDNTGLRLAEKL